MGQLLRYTEGPYMTFSTQSIRFLSRFPVEHLQNFQHSLRAASYYISGDCRTGAWKICSLASGAWWDFYKLSIPSELF